MGSVLRRKRHRKFWVRERQKRVTSLPKMPEDVIIAKTWINIGNGRPLSTSIINFIEDTALKHPEYFKD